MSKSKSKREPKEEVVEEDDEEINLCDDHDYQVLSALFETDSGRNVADILSKIQKDLHILSTSVTQLIQLSLAAHRAEQDDSEEDND